MAQSGPGQDFTTYDEFTDSYGAKVTVRESSAAKAPCVWVFVTGGAAEGSAHLDEAQAARLRDALGAWLAERFAERVPGA